MNGHSRVPHDLHDKAGPHHGAPAILPLRVEPPRDPRWSGSPLASLASGPLSARFCAWRGASEQRYVASVYPVDRAAVDAGLPDFDAYVLIAVARGALGRRIVDVAAVERTGDRRGAIARGLSRGADEWHVHFLAEDRRGRAAMAADLWSRHGAEAGAARCA